MAVNNYDPANGRPRFNDNDAPDIKVDPDAASAYAADVGNRIVRANLAGLNAYTWKRQGLQGHALDTGQDYLHNGTGWVATVRDSGWIPVTFAGTWQNAVAGEECEIRLLNGVVYMKGRPAIGAAGTAFTLPVGMRPKSIIKAIVAAAAGTTTTQVTINTGGTVVLQAAAQPFLASIAPFPADG